jgi:ATP-binding cassette subfamily B protein
MNETITDLEAQGLERTRDGIDLALWRKLWRFAMAYSGQAKLLALFAVGTASFDAALPWVTKHVVDDLTDPAVSVDPWAYGMVYLGLALGLSLCVWGFISVGGRMRTGIGHDIRSAGFGNLQELSFAYYDKRPVGWLMARMTSDCERLTNILVWGLLDVVWGATVMAGVSIAMLIVDWRLGLTILTVVPLLAWISSVFQKRILASSRVVRKTNSRLTASYNEGIMGVRTSKSFVRENENLAEFSCVSDEMNAASVRNALQSAVYLPIVLVLSSLAIAMVVGVGGERVMGAAIPLGTLVMFLSYCRLFFDPIQELARLFAEMQMAQASAERVLGLIEAEPEIVDSAEVREAIAGHAASVTPDPELACDGQPDCIGVIQFRGVGFQYDGGQHVLEDFDLRVEAGQTIALVGQTGGGKSTILSLLCRFYEPTAGRIEIDGIDYRERSLQWLQSNMGIVLQAPQLFSGTIAENIRYGDLDATDEEVQEAARLVGAHEFIMDRKDGYNTEVGEGGGLLSTGQKQLVSFARAILKSPRILVMDEATSSIDTETEERIQQALARVLEDRTSFVIAHRLSTIRNADRILVIEHGRIVESGTHASLVATRGRYHALYTQQSLRTPTDGGDSSWGMASPSPVT